MVIETITLSFIFGKIKGGKIRNLENLYINGWGLFVLSFILEIVSLLIVTRSNGKLSVIVENNFFYVHLFIYILLIVGLIMNFHSKGLRIVLFGSILNFLVLLLNNGKMPVSIKTFKYSNLYNQLNLLEEGRIITHSLVDKNTKLAFLGDIIPVPKPYIFPKIISIGDILISIGLFILIYSYIKRGFESEGKIMKFNKP